MGKLLKWLLGLVLLLLLLIVAAVVILPLVIDPNDYKDEIVARVKQETGRDLVIRDPLDLSVFPNLALRLGGVTLSNAPGFGEDPFARVEELDLRVGLFPLLERRVAVDTVVLKGLGLHLARNESGETNWADLVEAAQPGKAPAEPTAPAPQGTGEAFSVAVQGVQIENARVVWDDRQANQRLVVEELRIVTGSLAAGAEVPVEAGLRLTSNQPPLGVLLGLDGTVAISADFSRFQADDLSLRVAATGEGLPEGGLGLDISGEFSFDQAEGSLGVKRLELAGQDVNVTGDLAVTGLKTVPDVRANLSLQETNLKNLLGSFGVVLETADAEALNRVSGAIGLRMAGGAATVDPLQVTIDQTQVDGEVKIPAFDGPVVRATLAVDAIDLDRYLPPAAPETATPVAASESGKTPEEAGDGDPFAALRTLDLEATATVGKLTVSNLRLSDVKAMLTSKQGVLRVDPAQARLYQGGFKGLVELDARQRTPKIQLKQTLSGIQIGPLLNDLVGEQELSLTGTGEVESNLRMVGLSDAQIRNSLNGTGRFAFRDGAVEGINVAHLIRQAKAALGRGPAPPEEPPKTDFTEMSGSVQITSGLIENRDLQAKSPLLRIHGKGQVSLPKDRVDYLITTEVVQSLEGQGGKGRDELAGVPIPIRLTGDLASPKPSVDLESALSEVAKQKLEEKKEELQQDLQEKAEKELGKALKGIFGR